MIRILLVHKDPLIHALLELFLKAQEDYQILDSADFPMTSPGDKLCDLLLIDLEDWEYAKQWQEMHPQIKMIVMTAHPEYSYIDQAKNLGAESFWYIEPDPEAFHSIINRTLSGESVYPSCSRVTALGAALSSDFTERELEVLREVVGGKTDAAIAQTLRLSVATVKFHIKKIREKTGFSTRTELAVRARESGLVIPR